MPVLPPHAAPSLRPLRRVVAAALLLACGAFAGSARAQTTLIHQWTFNDAVNPLNDSVGSAHGSIFGGATVTPTGQLVLDGVDDYFLSAPFGDVANLGSKSLVVWVSLPNVTQRAGSALTVGDFTRADVFDGVVFAEHVSGQWMAGSEFYNRTTVVNNGGLIETTVNAPLMLAITYDNSNNLITIFRDGVVYASYTSGTALLTYTGTTAQATIGLRHLDNVSNTGTATGDDSYLAATIDEARVYNGALTSGEIASLFGAGPVAVPEPSTLALLSLGLFALGARALKRRRRD